jgi:hypothetical protein
VFNVVCEIGLFGDGANTLVTRGTGFGIIDVNAGIGDAGECAGDVGEAADSGAGLGILAVVVRIPPGPEDVDG